MTARSWAAGSSRGLERGSSRERAESPCETWHARGERELFARVLLECVRLLLQDVIVEHFHIDWLKL